MKRILLVGSGAREHVIGETLKRSRHEVELLVFGSSKNPGLMGGLAEKYEVGDICEPESVCRFAQKSGGVDFAIIGPEAPIAAGVVDGLKKIGVASASPLKSLGRLESSKGFARDLLKKYGIEGNPKFRVFESETLLGEFFEELGENFVVKADGLMGGKGVKVGGEHLANAGAGISYANECLKESGRVVVEEKLLGQEFSLMSFCDGSFTASMPAAQDHKRAFDRDLGPNTGGMGSYSCKDFSLPFLRREDIFAAEVITQKVAEALRVETGECFKGVMYGGFMATRDGVKLIEYNARFGDPEVMNALPLLESDFVDLCEAIINGDLKNYQFQWKKKATVCKYLVPEGYPDKPCRGEKIEAAPIAPGVKRYFGSVDQREDGLYLSGSRAVAYVGIADDLESAERLAEEAAASVKGPVFHRKDIGTADLIAKRVRMMRELRAL